MMWMTHQDVMDYLRISRSTLTRIRRSGKLDTYRNGRTVRFKKEDVDKVFERTS